MKKTLLAAIIAATALVPPALAQDRGHRWGGGDRSGNSGASQPSQAQPQQNRGGWRQSSGQTAQPAQPRREWNGGGNNGGGWNRGGDRPQWNGGDRGARPQWNGGARPAPQPQAVPQQQAQPQQRWDGNRGGNDGRRDWNRDRGSQGQSYRGNPNWNDRNRGSNWNGDRNRGGDWNRNRGGDWNRNNNRGWDNNRGWNGNDRGRWNNGWRNDGRYDWRGYRNSNRSLYRLPRYYAPSGWGYGYRRFSIGYTLNSILFSSQYWINDPFYYRLPEVYGPYRWVRYYNDALLVDVETGEVVDVIYDIFW
jgi:hypothetical protein